MKKVLINGYGDVFYSKINANNANESDSFFTWRKNIFKIKKQILKENKKTRKIDSIKSKKNKWIYKNWKKSVLALDKSIFGYEYKIKSELLKKEHIDIYILDWKICEKNISKDSTLFKFNNLIQKSRKDMNSLFEKKIQGYGGKNFSSFVAKKNVIELINSFVSSSKKLLEHSKNLTKNKLLKGDNVFFKDQSKVFKKYKIEKNNLLKKLKITKNNKNKHFKVLEHKVNYFRPLKNDSYDFQFSFKEANAKLNYLKQKHQILKKNKITKNKLKSELSKLNKDYSPKFKAKISKLRSNFRREKENLNINFKATKSSKRAKEIELKRIKNNFQMNKRELKISNNAYKNKKNQMFLVVSTNKKKLKQNKKNYIQKIDDIWKWTPVEITKKKYWVLVILGSVFPGFLPFFRKQWFKGILLSITVIIFLFFLAWCFGAFPTSWGNGLMGLQSLGWDTETQNVSKSIIGLTNGEPNNGIFYLVTGTISIVMVVVILGFFVIQALNNINVANLLRLGVRETNFKQQKEILKGQGLPYLISAPAFLFILFIVVVPVIATVLIAFTNINQKDFYDSSLGIWRIADGSTWPIQWVGFEQFEYIFVVVGEEFLSVLAWTLIWTFGTTILVIFLGTTLAILLNQKRIKGKTFFSVIYILPWAIPAFIMILFFSIIFQKEGLFNDVFGNAFFGYDINWMDAGYKTMILMVLLQGWLGYSYIFLLVTGTMQSIPKSLYESARVDGATNIKQFTGITAPLITRQIAPLLIGQFVFAFNNFGFIYLFNGGGLTIPPNTAGEYDILISWVYRLITSGTDSKPAAAAAITLFISIFTVTPSAFLFLRSKSFRGGNF